VNIRTDQNCLCSARMEVYKEELFAKSIYTKERNGLSSADHCFSAVKTNSHHKIFFRTMY